ncbi:DUF2786 domain-containing protein [Pseudovibrio exalbescens]|uniref:DUF7168 domain-containing protein n=1 Tax=Pseudovibrio exalbescens TaxID=197461 RepID=UPI0023660048|nr:DUF2786 domain-containing protein [Pseudovibrio exalbescens]MDD7908541.1 DUF2786 domain-containing protein [Pseudovibrio exalbescens]
MTQANNIRDKIAKLKQKTKANGCSEAEALAAAEKVASLMREHGISESEIGIDQKSANIGTKGNGSADRLWNVIAHCTNTVCIYHSDMDESKVIYVGMDPYPDIAEYLHVVCARALKRGVREFKKSRDYRRLRLLKSKRQACRDYVWGFTFRLSNRLRSIFEDQASKDARGRAKAALPHLFPSLSEFKRRPLEPTNQRAIAAGMAAGNTVSLSSAVNQGRPSPTLEASS